MLSQKVLCLTAVLCLLGGCNQPAVTPKAPAFQSSENTVRDWTDVASRIASEMASRALLPNPGIPTQENAVPSRPVFVKVLAQDSAFVRVVANELESDILRRGGLVARTPFGATVVNLDVDFIQWSPRDKPPGLAGLLGGVLMVPGIVIGDSIPLSTWVAADAAGFGATGLGLLTDSVIALTPSTNTEAIWKATIVTDDMVVMMLREPVYIRAGDIPLYAKAGSLPPIPSWTVGHASLPTRPLRFGP